MLDERFRQPMFHPDKKPSEVGSEIAYDAKYIEELMEIGKRFKPVVEETVRRV